MKITEYINPYNVEHMEAYAILNKTGIWPTDFIPADTMFDSNWQTILAYKIAKLWTKEMLAGNIKT